MYCRSGSTLQESSRLNKAGILFERQRSKLLLRDTGTIAFWFAWRKWYPCSGICLIISFSATTEWSSLRQSIITWNAHIYGAHISKIFRTQSLSLSLMQTSEVWKFFWWASSVESWLVAAPNRRYSHIGGPHFEWLVWHEAYSILVVDHWLADGVCARLCNYKIAVLISLSKNDFWKKVSHQWWHPNTLIFVSCSIRNLPHLMVYRVFAEADSCWLVEVTFQFITSHPIINLVKHISQRL